MCGIAGIIAARQDNIIEKMTDAIRHRGPDDCGFYSDEGITLGHRRLSIIDLTTGRQPIGNESGSVQLICNGEIYNSPELRQRLINSGHRFSTSTDVEVILHLYEEHGRDCVRHLRGMFAFAVWDRPGRKLLLARDHMGQKPLFYFHGKELFMFASEPKAILATGLLTPEIDLDALWHYISLRFMPDKFTMFKEIKKLSAASTLMFSDGKVEIERYWNPAFKPKISQKEPEITEGLKSCLLETVNMHLLSDVPVGGFLSGGIDSGTICAMMATMSREPVETFSIGVKEQGFNELPYARQVNARYKFNYNEEIVSADLIRLLPEMIYHLDEPSDPFGVGVYLVSREARKRVKVVLTGDGGDENFAGYDRFAGQKIVDYYCFLPGWIRKKILKRVFDLVPETFGYKSLAQKLRWLNEMSCYRGGGERYAQSMSHLRFTQEAKQLLFTKRAKSELNEKDSLSKILVHFDSGSVDDLIDKMLYTDLMTRMPDHLLPIVDRMSMAHSLEARPPMVDFRLVEYAAAIPANLKLKGRDMKYILKKVASEYLPDNLIYRKKQGFGFPLAIWMRTELNIFLKNLFNNSRFVAHGIFEKNYIDRIVGEHLSGRVDHNFRIWILINLEIWYRMFIEGESVKSMNEFIISTGEWKTPPLNI